MTVVADKLHASEDDGVPEHQVDSICSSAGTCPGPANATKDSDVEMQLPAVANRKIMITISDPPTPPQAPDIDMEAWAALEGRLFGNSEGGEASSAGCGIANDGLGQASEKPLMPTDIGKAAEQKRKNTWKTGDDHDDIVMN